MKEKVSILNLIGNGKLEKLDKLYLLSKLKANSFLRSVHYSQIMGQGTEFSQYRAYQPGDDIRRLDWKMYARSDKFFVRESDQSKGIKFHFILDGSASMLHEDEGLKKLDYSKYLTAALAYIGFNQGDEIELSIINSDQSIAYGKISSYKKFVQTIHPIKAKKTWDENFHINSSRLQKTLIIVLSDFHEMQDEIKNSILKARHANNEILTFCLLSDNEINCTYSLNSQLQDLETKEIITIKNKASQKKYLEQLEKELAEYKQEFAAKNIDFQIINCSNDIDQQIKMVLEKRMLIQRNLN